MSLYLGSTILFVALLYVTLLFFQQFMRTRAHQANYNLKRNLLEKQVHGIISNNANTAPKADEAAWSGWRKFRVKKIVQENDTIKSFYFVPHDGKSIASFEPGQHITFQLKVPGQSKPVIRCYSLSNSNRKKNYYRVSIKKQVAPPNKSDAPNGVSSCYFHDELVVGDVLDVRAPSGKFYLDLTEKTSIVLIGGGIGLTPSLSMLNTLFDMKSKRKIHLLYAVQNKHDQIMEKRLLSKQAYLPNLSFHRFYTECDDSDLSKTVHKGFIDCAKMKKLGIKFDSDFYVCGPPPMMNAIVEGLESNGVSKERIHFESFGPASISKKNIAKKPVVVDENFKQHTVSFSVSDKKTVWDQSQGSVLDVAEAVGAEIQSGCRAGSCGTCLTKIIEGEVSYVDDAGVDIEQGSCLACIAVPNGPLKLQA